MSIQLTPKAVETALKIKADQKISQEQALRITVVGGGCSGLSYQMSFGSVDEANDKVFNFGDLKVAVDNRSYLLLNGLTVDYHDGLDGKGFSFENPNAEKTCGCGTSFKA